MKNTQKTNSKISVSDSLSVKYRPKKLEDMIGNEVAKAAITGMLNRKTFPNTLLLHGGTGMGKCLVGSTLVNTSLGMMRLDELITEENLWGFFDYTGPKIANIYGKLEKPSRAFRKVADITIKLKTKFGTIEGTPEHPMFGVVDGILGYHRLDKYASGDTLAVPNILLHKTCSLTTDSRPDYFSYGCAISAAYDEKNSKFETANELDQNLFSDTSTINKTLDWVSTAIRNDLPKELFLPINAYEFIRGLLSASMQDGFKVSLPSKSIANQVKNLLMIWNIRSCIVSSRPLEVSIQDDKIELAKLFGFNLPSKECHFEFRYVGKLKKVEGDAEPSIHEENHIRKFQRFTTVVSVVAHNEPKIVYDLEMPESHSFQTECLISHNTTMARMLARYVNCETGDSCGICPSCKAGDASPDILEMNMATERGIDEVRNLILKSRLAPRFNKRIFILDELHQCFVGCTEVLLADGNFKRIDKIAIGDKVLSFNHKTKNNVSSDVTEIHSLYTNRAMVEVICANGIITCTHEHKWWNETQKEYVRAFYLKPNDLLKTPNGTTTVIKVQLLDQKDSPKVFDITVPKNSNFFVRAGSDSVLVHNCTPQAKEALLKPLEEPAKDTMWILCTTEPEKLTKTILGRCQQINVSPPTSKELVKHLRNVCKDEGVKINAERLPVLKHIAEASMGHSRNALQMLETFINLLASDRVMSIDEIQNLLTSTSGSDNDELAAHLLANILLGNGRDAVKLLYQVGQNKDVMGIISKLKWLLDYKLNSWAGVSKFNPHINQLFEKKFGKNNINAIHLIKILSTLVDCEVKIKTVSGLDDRIYFTSKILDDMVKIVESK